MICNPTFNAKVAQLGLLCLLPAMVASCSSTEQETLPESPTLETQLEGGGTTATEFSHQDGLLKTSDDCDAHDAKLAGDYTIVDCAGDGDLAFIVFENTTQKQQWEWSKPEEVNLIGSAISQNSLALDLSYTIPGSGLEPAQYVEEVQVLSLSDGEELAKVAVRESTIARGDYADNSYATPERRNHTFVVEARNQSAFAVLDESEDQNPHVRLLDGKTGEQIWRVPATSDGEDCLFYREQGLRPTSEPDFAGLANYVLVQNCRYGIEDGQTETVDYSLSTNHVASTSAVDLVYSNDGGSGHFYSVDTKEFLMQRVRVWAVIDFNKNDTQDAVALGQSDTGEVSAIDAQGNSLWTLQQGVASTEYDPIIGWDSEGNPTIVIRNREGTILMIDAISGDLLSESNKEEWDPEEMPLAYDSNNRWLLWYQDSGNDIKLTVEPSP